MINLKIIISVVGQKWPFAEIQRAELVQSGTICMLMTSMERDIVLILNSRTLEVTWPESIWVISVHKPINTGIAEAILVHFTKNRL